MAPYANIAAAAVGALALAWIADLLTGRRSISGTVLMSGVGATCGAFLAIRVFAIATLSDWPWIIVSLVASGFCLVAFFLFRNKR